MRKTKQRNSGTKKEDEDGKKWQPECSGMFRPVFCRKKADGGVSKEEQESVQPRPDAAKKFRECVVIDARMLVVRIF